VGEFIFRFYSVFHQHFRQSTRLQMKFRCMVHHTGESQRHGGMGLLLSTQRVVHMHVTINCFVAGAAIDQLIIL
jgi:hypothetical protein